MNMPTLPGVAPAPRRGPGRPKGSTNKRSGDLQKYVEAQFAGLTPGQQSAQIALVSAAELREARGDVMIAMAFKAKALARLQREGPVTARPYRADDREACLALFDGNTPLFFHASERPGERLGARAVPAILADMAARGIRTRLGEPPRSFTAEGVVTAEGSIPADMILFMPGLEGPDWAAASGLPLSPGGFFRADVHCRVEGAQRVYVAGDAGSHPGPDWLPKQAHMAELQADAAARNLLDELAGRPPRARPRPELLCVIDTLDAGTLVYRGARRSWMLPRTRLLHWAKKRFEARYLGALRRGAPPV